VAVTMATIRSCASQLGQFVIERLFSSYPQRGGAGEDLGCSPLQTKARRRVSWRTARLVSLLIERRRQTRRLTSRSTILS